MSNPENPTLNYTVVFGTQDISTGAIKQHTTTDLQNAAETFIIWCQEAKAKYNTLDYYREKFMVNMGDDEFEPQNIGSVDLCQMVNGGADAFGDDATPPDLQAVLQLKPETIAELKAISPFFFEHSGYWLTSGNLFVP